MINLRQIISIPYIRPALFGPSFIGAHRWNIFNGEKYLNCQEKIKNCNSIVFEDYSLSKKLIVIEDDIEPDPEAEPEDPGMIALTYYHF